MGAVSRKASSRVRASGTRRVARRREVVLGAWPDIEPWSPRCSMTFQLLADRSKLEASRLALVADFVLDQQAVRAEDVARLRHEVLATATELLENAVKYATSEEEMVTVRLTSFGGTLCVESSNRAPRAAGAQLVEVFRRLATEDPIDLLLEQLERSSGESSGIGLLRLRADFDLGLGVCIHEADREQVTIRTRAFIPLRRAAA